MKYFCTLCMALVLLFAPSCKKDNNDISNPTNTNTRTGIELLLDRNATTYCIIINSGDTMIWQNTRGDSMILDGGVVYGTTPLNYMATCIINSSTAPNWRQFIASFQMPENYGSGAPACGFIDSLISTGAQTINGTTLTLSITDAQGVNTCTWGQEPGSSFKILSITPISTGSGCYKLRVKATFSNVSFTLYHCAVQHPYVQQGEFQLDFSVNP
jgi:hypothetical protein